VKTLLFLVIVIKFYFTRTHTKLRLILREEKKFSWENFALPVFLSGKSESYFTMADGGCGILYGWELAALAPAGSDSPEELLTTPLWTFERKSLS
jgi:hypothetical protein